MHHKVNIRSPDQWVDCNCWCDRDVRPTTPWVCKIHPTAPQEVEQIERHCSVRVGREKDEREQRISRHQAKNLIGTAKLKYMWILVPVEYQSAEKHSESDMAESGWELQSTVVHTFQMCSTSFPLLSVGWRRRKFERFDRSFAIEEECHSFDSNMNKGGARVYQSIVRHINTIMVSPWILPIGVWVLGVPPRSVDQVGSLCESLGFDMHACCIRASQRRFRNGLKGKGKGQGHTITIINTHGHNSDNNTIDTNNIIHTGSLWV